MSKKVLIISYLFPPCPDIGAQRPYKLAKYFQRYGWKPIVLTAKSQGIRPDGIRIIETGYNDILSNLKSKVGLNPQEGIHEHLGITVEKNFNYSNWKSKIIKFVKEAIAFPDVNKGWFTFAVNAASNLMESEHIDAIISTSSPVTAHLIAGKLKQKYKIPWVAEFRDPWTQNPYNNKFGLIRYFERQLELKTISNTDAIVTVTIPWIDLFKSLHKNKHVYCITNGYDTDDFPEISARLTSKFTITYSGQLYNGKRDPSILFEVIRELINEHKVDKKLIEVRFYGPAEDWLIEEIEKYKLNDIVTCYGLVPREVVLNKQIESQILLLLLWNNKNEAGFCPGKLYEYFGAKRPILAIGGHGSYVRELLERTNSGKFVQNSVEMKDVLLKYYREFIESGEVKCHSNSSVENYRYDHITKEYSEILNGLVTK